MQQFLLSVLYQRKSQFEFFVFACAHREDSQMGAEFGEVLKGEGERLKYARNRSLLNVCGIYTLCSS